MRRSNIFRYIVIEVANNVTFVLKRLASIPVERITLFPDKFCQILVHPQGVLQFQGTVFLCTLLFHSANNIVCGGEPIRIPPFYNHKDWQELRYVIGELPTDVRNSFLVQIINLSLPSVCFINFHSHGKRAMPMPYREKPSSFQEQTAILIPSARAVRCNEHVRGAPVFPQKALNNDRPFNQMPYRKVRRQWYTSDECILHNSTWQHFARRKSQEFAIFE